MEAPHCWLMLCTLQIEFKIIDFGWAVAAAVDDEEVSELMKEQLPAAIGCGKCFCCYLVGMSRLHRLLKAFSKAKPGQGPVCGGWGLVLFMLVCFITFWWPSLGF